MQHTDRGTARPLDGEEKKTAESNRLSGRNEIEPTKKLLEQNNTGFQTGKPKLLRGLKKKSSLDLSNHGS